MLALLRFLAVLGLIASIHLSAQEARWQLPEGCVVIYEQTGDAEGEQTEDGREPRRVSMPEYPYTPPIFFEAELDERRQFLTQPVFCLSEIALHLAVDLRYLRSGRRVIDVPMTAGFEPYQINVRYEKIAADGSQRVVATVNSSDRKGGAASRSHQLLDLEMEIRRKVDLENGRVPTFDVKAVWQWRDEPGRGTRKAKVEEVAHYELQSVEAREDESFRQRVQAAVENGARYLLEQLRQPLGERDVRLGPKPADQDPASWYGPGYRALTTLTLIKAGLPKQHETLQAAVEDLRRLDITESYSLACAIMAMEAYYAPDGTDQALQGGAAEDVSQRKLDERDLAIVQEWTDRLLHNHDVEVDKAYRLRFRYHHASGYDNSVSQYAMLGLYSAGLCGVRISPQVWFAAADHWLDQATITGEKAMRVEIGGPGSRLVNRKRRTSAQLPAAKPCRWDYFKDHQPSASMTAAGVTGVTVCLAALRDLERGTAKLRRELEDRRRGGLVWLSRNYSMRAVVGDPSSYFRHRDYYWFGFERAMELNEVELLQGRDWFFEGAQIMLGLQRSDGSWDGSLEATCFCVLFLKKAVSGPVVPILQRPITPGGRR